MASEVCLILHRKSANEPVVKEAVKYVRSKGIDLGVRIPWNKKAKPKVVKEAIADGAKRVIAGGGDGTINAIVNALVGKGKKKPKVEMGVLPLGTANDFAHGLGLPCDDLKQCLEIACTAPAQVIDVGLPGHAIPLALFLFNVGVEVGQLLFVAAVLAVLAIARRRIDAAPRWASLAPAYAIGALAMFWTLERLGSLGS